MECFLSLKGQLNHFIKCFGTGPAAATGTPPVDAHVTSEFVKTVSILLSVLIDSHCVRSMFFRELSALVQVLRSSSISGNALMVVSCYHYKKKAATIMFLGLSSIPLYASSVVPLRPTPANPACRVREFH